MADALILPNYPWSTILVIMHKISKWPNYLSLLRLTLMFNILEGFHGTSVETLYQATQK
jgi:hypothetical protein